MSVPPKIKPKDPRKPKATPMYWRAKTTVVKKKTPTSKVNMGVNEFIIAATDESIYCCANAKKNEGKKVPKNPVITSHFHCLLESPFRELKPISIRKIVLNIIRTLPSSMGLSPTSPRFIKI